MTGINRKHQRYFDERDKRELERENYDEEVLIESGSKFQIEPKVSAFYMEKEGGL